MTTTTLTAFGRRLLAAPSLAADAAIERSRGAALASARLLEAAKSPAHALAEAGLRAQAAAGDSMARLVRNNMRVVEGLLDEGVRRLERAARADSLRTLVADQIELLGDTRARMSADAHRTLALLSEARMQVGAAFAGALSAEPVAREEAPRRRPNPHSRKTTASKRTRKPANARRRTR
jgi:hypothetical protein